MLAREGICGSLRCLRNDLSAPQNRWKQHFGRIWIKDVYLMKKATIIFGSTTGNTETVADMIAENMVDYEVKIVYVTDAKDDSSVQEADLVLYGCSTMGLGELQEDFIPYYESRMTSTLLKGKDVAVFGLGDKENYEEYFCWSADILSKKVKECGANLVCEPLKVDGEPDDNTDAVAAWAKAL